MFQRLFRKPKHLRAIILLLFLGAFIASNALAYLHAHAFTHFVATGDDTEPPDKISWKQMAGLLFTGPTVTRPEIDDKPAIWTWYTVHTFPSTDDITLEAWYIARKGSAATVVMFHGYGSSKSSLLDESAAFRTLGYSTLLVDFRGSGGSSGSVTTLGYREADDVAAAVEYARKLEPGKPVFVYGSSMGSVAALRAMAVKGVRPAGAILECPFDTLLSTVKNRFRMMRVPPFPAAHLFVFWGGLQFGFNGFAHNATDYAAKVDVPVLLIGGDEDRRVTVDQLQAVHGRLSGPKSLEIFKGAGHGGYVKHDGAHWREAVGDFMKKYR